MGHYKANVRDINFNLFEVYNLDKMLASDQYAELEINDVKDMIVEVAKLAEGPVADSYASSDRNPPTFDPKTHSVSLPEPFKKSLATYIEAGWQYLGISEELGGTTAPPTLKWALSEMILGSNPALFMYASGVSFAQILYHLGNEEQKKWAEVIAEDNWGSTMVLTEPDAGSDVGAGRTKAIKQPDGSWHIEGVKRFITSGDSGDVFNNIMHLVLARPEGEIPGTKGLSLFFVPKYLYDFDKREKLERNGVFVTNVEHKMGLKVSATCEITFGGHGIPARGWLVGDGSMQQGIRQMFEVIEHARMMVGTKAIATLSTGYLNALDYAKERVQGADLIESANKTAPRVTIIHHPDVRRSLQTQKAYAEGMRALYLLAATYQDDKSAELFSGADHQLAHRINDLLLPIVKGFGSEKSYEKLTESLQVFGGSGFLQDYPIEQYIRDAKIDSLYEGTTAIQALDFIFRKIMRDKMVAINHVLDQIKSFVSSDAGNGRLKEERELLGKAYKDYQESLQAIAGYSIAAAKDPREIYKVGLVSVQFLLASGDLIIGWLLLKQAEIALAALDKNPKESDKFFYEGKIATASFFAKTFLPGLHTVKTVITSVDDSLMSVPEEAF